MSLTPSFSLVLLLIFQSVTAYSESGQSRSTTNGTVGGGGTSVIAHSPETLVEFVESDQERRIDAMKFEGIYDRLRPKLERLNYSYPGIQRLMEETLINKRWKLTPEVFPPDQVGQLKPIFQDEYSVKINLQWYHQVHTNQKTLEKAWLHEMVRDLLRYRSPVGKYKSVANGDLDNNKEFQNNMNKWVYELTPIIYNEDLLVQFVNAWVNGMQKHFMIPFGNAANDGTTVAYYISGRSVIYYDIRAGRLIDRHRELCTPELLGNVKALEYKLLNISENHRKFYEEFKNSRAKTGYIWDVAMQLQNSDEFQYGNILKSNNRFNLIDSTEVNVASTFYSRTTMVLEGLEILDINKIWVEDEKISRNNYRRLSMQERQELLRQACDPESSVILEKLFSEFVADQGQVRNLSPVGNH